MTLPDVTILVSAFRSDTPHHVVCRTWITQAVAGESRFGLATQALSGFLRIVTHPRVFAQPSEMEEAVAFCDTLLSVPNCVTVAPEDRHWSIFTRICREADARGNLVPDAWFVALAIESGCEWITLDRDYARFPGLKWSIPT